MAVNLVSPGINVREIDLTSGAITVSGNPIGAFVGPFEKGPIDLPILIRSEKELLEIFGQPKSIDEQSEYWISAASYLSYGGALRVVRSNCSLTGSLQNPNSGLNGSPTTVKIKSLEDYNNQTPAGYFYASRNPGSWANGLKVCVIDSFADQTIGLGGTFGIQVGYGITVGFSTYVAGIGTVTTESGFLKGVISGLNYNSKTIDVKIVSKYNNETDSYTNVEYAENTTYSIKSNQSISIVNTSGNNIPIEKTRFFGNIANGITNISNVSSFLNVSVGDILYGSALPGTGVTITSINQLSDTINISDPAIADYSNPTNPAEFIVCSGIGSSYFPKSVSDWYNNQKLLIDNSVIYWKNVAPKPKTSQYSAERSSRNDQINVVVIDDSGAITATASNIIEKYLLLSKASDSKVTPAQSVYFKDYISVNSTYIFPGVSENGVATGFGQDNDFSAGSVANWGSATQGTVFSAIGNKTYNLTGGTDYTNGTNRYNPSLTDVVSSYSIFKDAVGYPIDYLICGPSGGSTEFESQAKAQELISIAEERKDCIAVISPHKASVVNISNSDTQTQNIIRFYSNITSSSYAVFDSGYKYTYDRFNNEFLYVSCNSDIAGIMARTSIIQYPWYSPAGTKRGVLNNVIKLAYNPNQSQRDLLYTNRINPIVSLPGQGTVLFGDKTALAYQSAFDRINVRKLFLAVEKSVKSAANDQLFEFNDTITRSNFVNVVEPYLRDIKTKRGVTDYLIVCDETNNTPEVIDANEFRADIYLKPERSINFITLTFVASRTGVSFQQVIGSI
jgi:hypothetical protein